MKRVKIDFYRDSNMEWRWEMYSRNGRCVGAATEGYKRRSRAIENLELVTGHRVPRVVCLGMRSFSAAVVRWRS